MTSLSKRRSKLIFTTEDCVREHGRLREVVIEAHPYHAEIRLKGMRSSYMISWAGMYNVAVKNAVEKARQDKKAAKKSR